MLRQKQQTDSPICKCLFSGFDHKNCNRKSKLRVLFFGDEKNDFNYRRTIDFVAPTKSSRIIFRRNLSTVKHSGELVGKFHILDLYRHHHLLGKHLVRKYYFHIQYFHNINMHVHNHLGHYKLRSNRFLLVEWQECTRELQWPMRSQCFGYNKLMFWPCTMICGKLIVLIEISLCGSRIDKKKTVSEMESTRSKTYTLVSTNEWRTYMASKYIN